MRRRKTTSKKPKNRFYKVSVWDERLEAFIVKKCCISDIEHAYEIAAGLEGEGFITSITPHIK